MLSELSYVDAIRQALWDELTEDDSVFLIGEDIGHFGGAFKATRGLLEHFGPLRVVDTPIAESLIMGTSIGAAFRGMRPVAEMQFADFVSCGFSQLVNNASTFFYRLKVPMPMVVRLPSGGGVGGGPFHSRNTEAWFTHVPGLKVVTPSNPQDAYSLLRASIRDPDPVLFFEQKFLYRREKAVVDTELKIPLGQALQVREGDAASLICYGNAVSMCLEAAAQMEKRGVLVDVIDLRCLQPWDHQAVLASVKKTHRALLVQEATRTSGFMSEVAAVLADRAFEYLDAPVLRVSAIDAPTPSAPTLEANFRPNAEIVLKALDTLLKY